MALVNIRFEDPETAFVASQIATIIFSSLWFFSRALLLGCELRILLQMFLNLNPYFYPIYYVWLNRHYFTAMSARGIHGDVMLPALLLYTGQLSVHFCNGNLPLICNL